MKRRLWAGLMALLMVGALCGCGGSKKADENLGKYVCTKIDLGGTVMDISQMEMGETAIELQENGKVVVTIDGESTSGEYKINGQQVHVTIEDETVIGSIADGEIRLDIEEMEFVFEKGAETANKTTEPSETPGEEPVIDAEKVGKYNFIGTDVMGDGNIRSAEESDLGETWLELKADNEFDIMLDGKAGDGAYSLDGETLVLDWEGIKYEGTLKDGVAKLDINTVLFLFEK